MTTSPPRVARIDSWVNEARPSDTHGPDAELLLRSGVGVRRYAYVFCARPWADSRGVTVVAAFLDLYVSRVTPASAATVQLRRVDGSWNEKVISWRARPSVEPTLLATSVIGASSPIGTRVRFDVTALLQDVADGAPYFGVELLLDPAVALGPIGLASSEAGNVSRRPTLTVTWSSPPDIPTDLRPSGSRFVSITKPTLSWAFGDVLDPSSYQSAYRVELDETDTLTPPLEYDSGQVTSGLSQVDLAATAYAGLPTDGALRYWRARVWDDSGEVSDPSLSVGLRYCPLGVVVINTPGATTADVRPEVSWTFTPAAAPASGGSMTQKAYRVTIEKQAAGGGVWTMLADSGLITGTATAWAAPGVLSDLAATYRATVYIADGLSREALVGAPALATATRTFTFAPSGTVTDATGFVATATADRYSVALAWSRATRPDHWLLEADGYVYSDKIDFAPSGTSYAWTWYGASPRKATTLKLHAVELVGGVFVVSTGVTATITTNPDGIWLVDEGTGESIHIAGKDALDADIGETSAVYPRIGDRAPVLVTELVRGYEGGVSGVLVRYDGSDPRAQKRLLLSLRTRIASLRLVLGDLNLPVAVHDVSANPTPNYDDQRFDVAFGFVQVGEFDRPT